MVEAAEESKPSDWRIILARNHFGQIKATLRNALLILQNDEAVKGILVLDEFAGKVEVERDLPGAPKGWLSDAHVRALLVHIEARYDVALFPSTMFDAVYMAAGFHKRHAVRDYLNTLKWDGIERLSTWLEVHARVEGNAYTRTIGRKWLISAVARVFEPGCQVDHVLVLEGEQRGGKTSLFLALCPHSDWILTTGVELGHKDAYILIKNKWLVILDELGSISAGSIEKIKTFITARVDSYVPKYGREGIDQLRVCAFGGTVNPDGAGYLKDATGGGRFWPVFSPATADNPLDLAALTAARDQIWAEAVHAYKAGERWHIDDPDVLALAQKEQEDRRQRDPWEETIARELARQEWRLNGVTVREVLAALDVDPARATKGESMRVARIMRGLGWEVSKRLASTRLYRPKEAK